LKGLVRFGILGAFVALAGVFGALGPGKIAEVNAQVPAGLQVAKTCTATNVNVGGTASCTVTITATAAVSVAEPIVVTVSAGATGSGTNPDYGRLRLLNGTTSATGFDVLGVSINNPSNGTPQTISLDCTGVTCDFAVGDVYTIVEGLQGAVGGPTQETIKFGANVPVSLTPTVTVNPSTVNATVVCTPVTVTAGSGAAGQTTCTNTFTDNDVFPNFVSSGTVTLVVTSPAGVVFGSTGTTTAIFNCGGTNAPQGCSTNTFTLQSNTGGLSGPVNLTLSYAPDLPAVDSALVGVTINPAVNIVAASGTTGTLTCSPLVVAAGTSAAGASTCTLDLNDTSAPTTTVSSGSVVVTLNSPPSGVALANGTATQTFRCPASGTLNTNDVCDSITFTVASNTANVTGVVSVTATYTPDLPQFDNPVTVTNIAALQVSTAQNLATFIQPAGLVITCPSTTDAFIPQGVPFNNPTPSQLGALNVIALGVLPSTLICTVRGVDGAGNVLTNFAPGTIDVTSVGGILLTSDGRFTTDLNVGCDAGGVINVVIGTTINPNTCTGVTFAVAGTGVGNVSLRARYLPSSIAVAAGIQERETQANVGFIAPIVQPFLLLSVNPVVVGQTGTATVRFNRTANCSLAFNTGLLGAPQIGGTGGTACVDPTTGFPIIFNFGSALNGNVVLTISDAAIASWAEATTPTTPSNISETGFVATAAQVVRRCGFFPTTNIPLSSGGIPSTTGGLTNFFGGCDQVSAVYRGNLPGVVNVTSTFIPDLPGAFGNASGVTAPTAAFLGLFSGGSFATSQRVLEVVAAPISGLVQLARGCNNVSPTVSEAATAYAARVAPAAALVAIWEHQAATNTFRGFSPLPAAPSDLAAVTRLRPVFVCVSGAATLDQPPA